MTPDQDAIETLRSLLEFCAAPETDSLLRIESEGGHVWEFDAKQFRAALRERDARWREAVIGSHACQSMSSDCEWCAPLRALLEEAGK